MLGLALYCAVWLSAITPALGRSSSFMSAEGATKSGGDRVSEAGANPDQSLHKDISRLLPSPLQGDIYRIHAKLHRELRDQLEKQLPETLALFYSDKVRRARKDHYLRSSAPDTLSDQILRVARAEPGQRQTEVFSY